MIVTLTLNPAVDVSTTTERVVPEHKLRCEVPRRDPGGGGINVARMVRALGGASAAVFPAGGPTGQGLVSLLGAAGLDAHAVPIAGETRQSFTVDEQGPGRKEYRFVMPGPELAETELEACLREVARLAAGASFVVASGSLPPGVPPEVYARLRGMLPPGPRLVVDSSGLALRHTQGAWMIKPSLRELQTLAARELPDSDSRIATARALIADGMTEVVVLSLGANGAMLITREEQEHFPAIPVPIRSTVGAGDSMVAAMALALERGEPLRQAVRFGMAAGAAALLRPGTQLCRREDVERLFAGESPE
ncbi:1-phosphofructokinase family hexose kinase [Roseomonas marmotae]|uniref:Phosphofructokinase n=1 Tax=Roseomonas marmotae TaxID=2768161 RepID=A0ABS3KGQ9_9PROT|nr:1-phosphofructokinase family hexose kinase [Roseomonas marmotae]MBO1076635.1 1-phosphofructokinase family hexose kinase [Roseomonas marmotae]QTI79624.1 1-phosphofructokinase family hexose kinase [Roseomonas marmotae]